MSLVARLCRGRGPIWGPLKKVARVVLSASLPTTGPFRIVFGMFYGLHVSGRSGLAWILRFLWYEPLFRSQCVAVGPELIMEMLPYLVGDGNLVLGSRVRLSGKSSFVFGNAGEGRPSIVLGDDTFLGHDCSIRSSASVTIGKSCLLAGRVSITDYDGHPLDAHRRKAGDPTPPEGIRLVVIGDDVWIGQAAIVLKGVTIGPRSIVGAGSVVVHDVPPDCVVAGNPARVVKRLLEEPGSVDP